MNAARARRRPLVVQLVVLAVALVIGAADLVVIFGMPAYRTELLVDASQDGGDFMAIADAVGAAAQNAADGDSLSLRRYGGACGDGHNTAAVVGPGTGHGGPIGAAVHALKPSGRPTLQSGLLAAIGDFAGYYPLRGERQNRIIVVTSHGAEACAADRAAVSRAAAEAGVRLDFRFVGYKVPKDEQPSYAQLAAATGAPAPKFVTTAGELDTTLKELTVPRSPEAQHVVVPSPSPSAPLADGEHYVYIKGIDVPRRRITVDEFEYYTHEQAKAEEQKDGLGPDYDDDGYYSRNPDKKTVDVDVAPDLRIALNWLDGSAGDPQHNRNVSLDELSAIFARQSMAPQEYFRLTMAGGRVTVLQEIWRP
ncbi:hypothetical protein [Dactylosporangium sp. NPDC049140]|uniref:hypothetical protein n=1 Tax=Dactylosporangium sp. NPDC049140 TaxID=3155647 RepID=UPI0033E0F27E